MADFTTIHITCMLDEFGDETDDHTQAVSFVAKVSDGIWIADIVRNYDKSTMN